MCVSKEPVAGVFLLLVLAAGGMVAQEPFSHFGVDLPADTLDAETPSRPVSPQRTMQLDEGRFSSAMLEPALYAATQHTARP
ncbi:MULTISPECIES: hypothetical protein [Pseudomonas syringae group]|uniref:Uncharacterized protein n=2 Tax=Pseudomonas syringae group TaxID=136849 RepID=A0AA40P9F2_9PSED|nr:MULTISPECIES: hypothetical protein [Pseudomonas syringae group]KGS15449.1 hypothetical protein OA77_05725 [Pseudomonas coronafaciens]KPB49385.1 Uncharacterized protein AC511_1791 [Pseudomonas coronafaciens pv. oryzae]KPX30072.1 Uncharacterized protein ALO77_02735 [Pseudomonas coronafaciens pv. garcae]KPY02639.1 Uncharacterized protein ALO57_03303 [Pseudomonas coronafaciens pv. oryzae]KPZ07856.1 Uncharacterized protein ALO43_03185 [Pseudomonas tremae]